MLPKQLSLQLLLHYIRLLLLVLPLVLLVLMLVLLVLLLLLALLVLVLLLCHAGRSFSERASGHKVGNGRPCPRQALRLRYTAARTTCTRTAESVTVKAGRPRHILTNVLRELSLVVRPQSRRCLQVCDELGVRQRRSSGVARGVHGFWRVVPCEPRRLHPDGARSKVRRPHTLRGAILLNREPLRASIVFGKAKA